MRMPETITIPISIFEVVIEYDRPNLRLAMTRTDIVEYLFDQFGKWDITVDDLEVVNEGKPSDQGVKFKIPKRKTTFFFSAAQARLTWDDANWPSAEETIEILNIALEALQKHGNVNPAKFKTALALHLQPENVPFVDLLKPFANPILLKLQDSPITAFATVLRWEGRRITIDGSAQLANAVFLRLERDFPGDMPTAEVAQALLEDERTIFAMLGVQEATA